MPTNEVSELSRDVLLILQQPFWMKLDFWISSLIGLVGLLLSFLAFREARQAKSAAVEAGRNVKVQTVAIDLSEVSQRLDRIEPGITYTQARDLLAEITRKLRRVISPFADDNKLRDAISALRNALDSAQDALTTVRPTIVDATEEAPQAIYYAMEYEFSNVNNLIADLIGLLEKGAIGLRSDETHE